MNSIIFNSDSIAIIISICTFVFSIFKFYQQDKINNKYEQAKFANQQNLKNYSIYIDNKHKRLIQVNDNLVTALGHVNDVSSVLQQKRYYDKYSVSQIAKYVDELKVNDDEKNSIISLLTNDKSAAIEKIYYWEDKIRCYEAKRLITNFRQSLLNARLYISEENYLTIDSFSVDLLDVVILVEDYNTNIYTHPNPNIYPDLISLQIEKVEKINNKFDDIIEIMRKELDYSNENKT